MDPRPPTAKADLRRRVLAARAVQPAKDALSARITGRVINLPEYRRATAVLWYIDCRSEVRTRDTVAHQLREDRQIVVPYVTGDQLRLWRLRDMAELAPGRFGILEPARPLRSAPDRRCQPAEVDLVVVPGVAFDPAGNRLGSGFGFYDRLLNRIRADARLVAPCFECQRVERVPVEAHDVPMHRVITECDVYTPDRTD